jgi:hypothetical protein
VTQIGDSDAVQVTLENGRTVLSPKTHFSDWKQTDRALPWLEWSRRKLNAFNTVVQNRIAEKLGRGNPSVGAQLFDAASDNFRADLMRLEYSGDLDATEVSEAISHAETSLAQQHAAIADARAAAWAEGEKKEKARLAAIYRNPKVKGNEKLAMDFAEAMPDASSDQVVAMVVAALGPPRQTVPSLAERHRAALAMNGASDLSLGGPLSAEQRSGSGQIPSPKEVYATRSKAVTDARNAE